MVASSLRFTVVLYIYVIDSCGGGDIEVTYKREIEPKHRLHILYDGSPL